MVSWILRAEAAVRLFFFLIFSLYLKKDFKRPDFFFLFSLLPENVIVKWRKEVYDNRDEGEEEKKNVQGLLFIRFTTRPFSARLRFNKHTIS